MLSVTDVLTLMAEGKPLPQQEFPDITQEQINDLQEFEPALLNRLIESEQGGEESVDTVLAELQQKVDRHGWYPVVATLCWQFAHRYHEDMVPVNLQLSDGTVGLLKMLPIASRAEEKDEGAWTIPFAMLASLGEEKALAFTVGAAMCAAVGFIQSTLEEEARG
ncbi:hypothetical protein SEA_FRANKENWEENIE_264 [Streptomyces phage Frankenweenie]|nr:hypothetical protein SEA_FRANKENWEENIE_264 [Streptomyces phage Frankenweenie]